MRLSRFVEFGRKIVCVGRNYKDHAAEMKAEIPDIPLLFMKPASAYITEGQAIEYPKNCKELHHEVELGVVVERRGKNIPAQEAMGYVGGYVVCLDMTARDLQDNCKRKGEPWEIAKGFDTSCPVSTFLPKEAIPNPHDVKLWCKVNGVERQNGNTKDMIFRIPDLISYISRSFTLEPGDLILTGTPAGVGPVVVGDTIEAGLGDQLKISFQVNEAKE